MAATATKLSGAVNRGVRAIWFRCDLRTDDNPALVAACSGASSLLPVYVFDPAHFNVRTLAGARKSSARRARFVLESVASLRRRLEASGSGLAVAVGRPEEVLRQWCAGYEAVFHQETVCSEEHTAEIKVAKAIKPSQLNKVWGGTLFMPTECGNDPNNIPLLFTNFKNKAEGRGRIQRPVDAPANLPPLPEVESKDAFSFMPSLMDLGYPEDEAKAAMLDDPRACMQFVGGEDAALERLQRWMFDGDNLKDYFDIRNGMLGEAYSSKLSPWLSQGCISPRRVWSAAQRYEKERVKNKSTYWLVFELTWRDFYIYMGRSQGDRIFLQGGITGDAGKWRNSPETLAKWKEGRTGDQLVDANMRELMETGFMSNRGRQNVASYLIFDLGIDWRYGAAHFEEHLLDHDPCSNWGNWVAAAGLTGQRVNKFNTRKQLNDYDPKREYVRHWLDGTPPAKPAAKADVVDDDSEAKMRARAERFGTGKAGGKGKRSGDGYQSSGGYGGAGKEKQSEDRKKGRWRKVEGDAMWQGA